MTPFLPLQPLRLLAIALLGLAASSALAQRGSFSSPDELGRWVTFYYLNPEPFRIPGAVVAASKLGMLKDVEAAPPFFGFLAGILHKEPSLAHFMSERLGEIAEADRPVIILGIWYSGHADTAKLMQSIAQRFPMHREMVARLRSRGARIVQIPMDQGAWLVDALWGYFMATGEDVPVIRIISTLAWRGEKNSTPKVATAESARWSLVANAVQHPRVMEILKAQEKAHSGDVAIALQEIISKANGEIGKKRESGPEALRTPHAKP